MVIEILGTSHVSEESIRKIKEKILELKPTIMAVELDEGRLHALLSKHRKVPASAMFQLGVFGYLFQLFGAYAQKKLGQSVKQMPGIDMKTAYTEAKKTGAKVFLIDLPIQITLKKLSAIPIFEKLKFGFYLISGIFSNEKIEIDLKKVPADELIFKLASDLKKQFPNIYKVLVSDRDTHIANQIRHLQKHFPDENVLIVLGAGHLAGVKKLLAKNNN